MTTLSKSLGLSSSLKEEAMVSKKQGIVSILGSDSERGKSAAPIRRTLSADMSSKQWLSQNGFSPLKKIASSDQFPAVFSSSDPPSSSSSEGEEEYEEFRQGRGGQFDIWTSIHEEEEEENKKKQQQQKKKEDEFSDIWSAIISQKAQEDPKNLPPPYIHPLVKRSASSLSEKSLAICTESLGSETGSDGFSSYQPSDNGDAENDDKEEGQQGQEQDRPAQSKYHMEDLHVVQYNNLAASSSKKSPPRSFPPPIPSLSNRGGASVHMKSHRDNGRLVLEAVSVPSQNNFRAQRQDGRLVLTLINRPDEAELAAEKKQEEKNDVEVEQFEVEMENSKVHGDEVEKEEEEEEEEEEENESGRAGGDGGWKEDVRFVMEEAPKFTSNGVIKLHRLALMMNTNRPMVLSNRNPTTTTTTTTISTTSWRNKFNEMVEFEIEEEEEEDEEEEEQEVLEPIAPLTQSLPPRPPMAARMIPKPTLAASSVATAKAAAFLNAYEYYWRPKPMSAAEAGATALHALTQKQPRINNNTNSSNKFILSKKRMTNDDQQELLVFKGNNGDNYLVPLAKSCKEPRKPLLFWDPCCIATS